MSKFKSLLLILCLLIFPTFAFASGIDVDASAASQSISQAGASAGAYASGGTGIGVGVGGEGGKGGNAQLEGSISAKTGDMSSNIFLQQKFEGTTIPREHIQAPGLAMPGVMNNFGPFTDTNWNIFPIGAGKTMFTRSEAEVLLGKGKGIESRSKIFAAKNKTDKIVIAQLKDGKVPEELKKGVVVGNINVRSKNDDNDTNEVLGKSLLDAMDAGATVLLLLRNGASLDNKASSLGIGISNGLSIIGGGAGKVADAVTTGSGYTTAKVGQRFFPYVHAVAIKDGSPISTDPIKPDIGIKPQSKLLEKQEREQTTVR